MIAYSKRFPDDSEELKRIFVEAALDAIVTIDSSGRVVEFNPAAENLFGFRRTDILGRELAETIIPEELRDQHRAGLQHYLQTGAHKLLNRRVEITAVRACGEEIPVELTITPHAVGNERLFTGFLRDISKRTQAERALRASEENFRNLVEGSIQGISIRSPQWELLFANQAFAEIYGYDSPAEIIAHNDKASLAAPHEHERLNAYRMARLRGEDAPAQYEYDGVRKDGTIIRLQVVSRKVTWLGQDAIQTTVHDITNLKKQEMALSENRAMLQTILETVPAMITLRDSDGRIVYCNNRAAEFYGSTAAEIHGKTTEELVDKPFYNPFEYVQKSGRTYSDPNVESAMYPGRKLWQLAAPLAAADNQEPGVLFVTLDVTEQHNVAQQLRQAQKMEIVGQLTGGVAHDFNNLLGVIIGNLDLIAEKLENDGSLIPLVEAATNAALNGANLNRQLLAFSRQQPLSPKEIDVNDQVTAMLVMLRRTLGETIEIEAIQGDGLWSAEADPTQVESALLNLAVNARDAMPDGGKLTIETANATLDDDYAAAHADVNPGDYVMLALTDTGTGIARKNLQHVFEPFFTTKGVGQGTGLGLSMVFGFAKQSGGHLALQSEIGVGTTARLYLPRATRVPMRPAAAPAEIPLAQGETVLLVEDDPDVQTMTGIMLRDLGYDVVAVGNGKAALEAMMRQARIDILLTDVVLPGGMSGPEIAESAHKILPAVRVLFMSGYSHDAVTRKSRLSDGTLLLEKPFRKERLAYMLRMALAEGNEIPSGAAIPGTISGSA